MTTLNAKKRDPKKNAATARKSGLVPGVAYGPAFPSAPLAVDAKEIEKLQKTTSEAELVTFELDGKTAQGFIHEYQFDPVTGAISHFDIYIPSQTHVATVKVPIRFEGKAPAADKGANIVKNLTEVKVEALPQDIPHEFVVDLSALTEPHQSLFVKDIAVASSVKVLVPLTTPVVTAVVEKVEAAAPPAAAAEAAEPQAPAPSPHEA